MVKAFSRYWKIGYVILGLGLIVLIAVLFDVGPCLKEIVNYVRKSPTEVIAFGNILLICITIGSLHYTRKTNTRAVSQFVGQIRPLIDVTPIAIIQDPNLTHAMTAFSIVNYSGFKACNIGIDLEYGEKSWIQEWLKAKEEESMKGAADGVVPAKDYLSRSKILIPYLEPGETRKRDSSGNVIAIQGSLKLEEQVCTKESEGIPVRVRTTWENINGHVFDAIHEYRLICTKADRGRSFTFIPKGIVSQKDAK
jgi:hypothetical protein